MVVAPTGQPMEGCPGSGRDPPPRVTRRAVLEADLQTLGADRRTLGAAPPSVAADLQTLGADRRAGCGAAPSAGGSSRPRTAPVAAATRVARPGPPHPDHPLARPFPADRRRREQGHPGKVDPRRA